MLPAASAVTRPSRPALIRPRLLWSAATTSGVALHREDGGGCGDTTTPVFLPLL